MKTKLPAFVAVVALALASAVSAQDAAKTSPEHYKVTFENEKVRVLEYDAAPGGAVCGLGKHSHPAHLTILLTDATVKVTLPDGKVVTVNGKKGDTFWEPAVTHEVENVGGTEAKSYVIELKDQDWKPSTGLTK